jgi:hypothetical protein
VKGAGELGVQDVTRPSALVVEEKVRGVDVGIGFAVVVEGGLCLGES